MKYIEEIMDKKISSYKRRIEELEDRLHTLEIRQTALVEIYQNSEGTLASEHKLLRSKKMRTTKGEPTKLPRYIR